MVIMPQIVIRLMVMMISLHSFHNENTTTAENKFSSRDIQFPGSIIFGILAYESWPANQILMMKLVEK